LLYCTVLDLCLYLLTSWTANIAWLYKQGHFPQLHLTSDVCFRWQKIGGFPNRYSTYVIDLVVDGEIVLEGRGIAKKEALCDLCLEVADMVTEAFDGIEE
jgi:hypothetical protein